MQKVSELLSLHEHLRKERHNYEKLWDSIARQVAPSRANFKEHRSRMDEADYKGKSRTEHIFDATPALALHRFSAALASLATPKNRMWHDVKPVDEDLAEDEEVKVYTDAVRARLFSARYSANFDTAVQECYTDAGVFGNACMYIGDRLGHGLYYRHVPLEQAYWQCDEYGVVDWVNREFSMTARAAYQRFGDKLPQIILDALTHDPNRQFWFLHVVKPRKDRDEQRGDARGMAFESVYISFVDQRIVWEGGFRTMPYAILRFTGDANYGEGPCALVLPDIKQLNLMNRDVIQAAQRVVNPALLAAHDGVFSPAGINLTPGAVNYGGVDESGRPRLIPLDLGGNLPIGIEMMDQKRRIINDALWNTLFQILVDTPTMTATEAMLRAQEKGALLAPAANRVESEFLEPTINRELDILASHGDLPDMPDALAERGGQYQIEYTNDLARYRRMDEGTAIMRAVEQLAPLAQAGGPEVLARVNWGEAAKVVLSVNGVPASVIRSDEQVQAILEQQAQEQQQQQILAAAPIAASAAKDMAQAQALAATAEQQQLPGVIPQ